MDRTNPVCQRLLQACLFTLALGALLGGLHQMFGHANPALDANDDSTHRFMGGIYAGVAPILFWAGATPGKQRTLIFLLAFALLAAASGRVVSFLMVGRPSVLALVYFGAEVLLSITIIACQRCSSNEHKLSR